jgi:long-chain acyl-CoA synthetase
VSTGRQFVDLLTRAVRLFPHKIAVYDVSHHPGCPDPHQFSWKEVYSRVCRAAGVLRGAGVADGDRVAVLARNCHQYFEAYFAVPMAGGILVPLNFRLADEELTACLQESEPRVLLCDARNLERASSLSSSAPSVQKIYCIDDVDWEQKLDEVDWERRLADPAPQGVVAKGPEPDRSSSASDENAAVGIFYTGGASGDPKGVVLTHRNLYDAAVQIALAMGYREDDVYIHCGPMFHLADGAGSFATTLCGGAHVFVPSFEPDIVLESIQRYGVTTMTLVPTMYKMLLDSGDFHPSKLSSLKRAFFSAAPMPEAMLRELVERLPCGIGQGYGMTETSSRISVMDPSVYRAILAGDDRRTHLLRSAGREIPGLEVRIGDVDRALGPGEVGEILVRGTTVMREYWRKPKETAEALAGGWMHTGDLGFKDEEGFLYVVDRKKDMIVSGGENVYSLEVENWLVEHEAVAEASVIGVPDELWGERVHAVVVTKPGRRVTEAELRRFLKQHIAGYKVPKSFEFRSELPRTAAGKVRKDLLKGDPAT